MWLLHNLTSSGLLSWRGAVRDDGELGLQVHVVVADVPCGESYNKIIRHEAWTGTCFVMDYNLIIHYNWSRRSLVETR